jgi:WD40 repeat protein
MIPQVALALPIAAQQPQELKPLLSFQAHRHCITCIAFSPDGKSIATGSGNLLVSQSGEAKCWDISTAKELSALKQPDEVCSLVYMTGGGKLLLACRGQPVSSWDLSNGTVLSKSKNMIAGDCAAFGLEEHHLATVFGSKITLWDYYTGQELRSFEGHLRSIRAVTFSPDGHTLASGGSDKTIVLWEVASGKTHTTLRGHTAEVLSVAFSPDGGILASGASDNSIILWDVASGKTRTILNGHSGEVLSVAFSPDGRTLASGSSDKTIILWDVEAGKRRATLDPRSQGIGALAFSGTGSLLASGFSNGEVTIWRVK